MYQASVANNQDPLNEVRVTLLIPQILGDAESAWAVPASPTNTIPPVGQTVWVQFSGGDITKPVYSPLGIKQVQDQVDGLPSGGDTDVLPPKQPTALNLTTAQFVTNEGITLARVTATWTPPTENQDGTNLTDLAHYVLQYSYDGTTWLGGTVTQDTLVVIDGLHTGVDVTVRVQAVDTSNNVSLWASNHITSASSSTPPPVPSAPGVVGVLGGLRIMWDGKDVNGFAMPAVFSHVQVQRDTDPSFSNAIAIGTLPGADFLYDSVQNYGNAYYYRLVAFSKVGIASAPSAFETDTPKQAGVGDLAVNSVVANLLTTGHITAQDGVIQSLDAAKITVGKLTGNQLDANAINGKTISGVTITGSSTVTGSTVQTAATGNRIVMTTGIGDGGQTIGKLNFYTEVATDTPGALWVLGAADGSPPAVVIAAPTTGTPSQIKLWYDPEFGQSRLDVTTAEAWLPDTYVQDLTALGSFSSADYPKGTWQSFTPTWIVESGSPNPSFGNAVVDCRWSRRGTWVRAEYDITFGTTTTYGASAVNWRFGLPTPAARTAQTVGWFELHQSAGARCVARARLTSTAGFGLEISSGRVDGNAITSTGLIDSVSPWTWASTHAIRGVIEYEAPDI
jgi:hypothetical protein